jgi:hypothetical protein
VLSTIFMVMDNFCRKLLFDREPTLGVKELVFARGVLATSFLLIYMNKNIKRELYDRIEGKQTPILIFRCMSGMLV